MLFSSFSAAAGFSPLNCQISEKNTTHAKIKQIQKKNQNFRLCETIIFFSQPNTISITK